MAELIPSDTSEQFDLPNIDQSRSCRLNLRSAVHAIHNEIYHQAHEESEISFQFRTKPDEDGSFKEYYLEYCPSDTSDILRFIVTERDGAQWLRQRYQLRWLADGQIDPLGSRYDLGTSRAFDATMRPEFVPPDMNLDIEVVGRAWKDAVDNFHNMDIGRLNTFGGLIIECARDAARLT